MGIHLREKQLDGGRRSLYLDIYHNGKRRYEYLNIYLDKDTPANRAANREKLHTATVIRNQRENELTEGEYNLENRRRRKSSFFTYVEALAKTKSPGTRLVVENTLKHMRTYAKDEEVLFAHVTKEWLLGFREYLLRSMSQNSAHTLWSNVKTALRDAVRDEILPSNPMDKIARKDQIKRIETRRSYLTFEDVEKLAATPCSCEVTKRAFLFSCFAGLRLSDVEKLTFGNIRSGRIEFTQTKTGSKEYFDVSPQALEYIGTAGAPDDLVFSLPKRDTLGRILKRWCASARIEQPVTFHTARHTFATLLITYGADVYMVGKLLGHKSIQATQIYAKIIDRKRAETVRLLPTIGSITVEECRVAIE